MSRSSSAGISAAQSRLRRPTTYTCLPCCEANRRWKIMCCERTVGQSQTAAHCPSSEHMCARAPQIDVYVTKRPRSRSVACIYCVATEAHVEPPAWPAEPTARRTKKERKQKGTLIQYPAAPPAVPTPSLPNCPSAILHQRESTGSCPRSFAGQSGIFDLRSISFDLTGALNSPLCRL